MRTIFILQDSLVTTALGCYGGTGIPTPNFNRLAERGITFDQHYVGSLPCMPARREMHTGRMNFLHRSWGPLEPFDDCVAEILQKKGIYTHLVTDHAHYWEDGGSSYHNRYNSYEFIRGQEWDKWKAMVEPPLERFQKDYHPMQFSDSRKDGRVQHLINREFQKDEKDFCTPRIYESAFEFLDTNRDADDWFLHIELFDPHEPFQAPERFRKMFPTDYEGPVLQWPRYKRVEETPGEVAELRANYSALVAMCDEYFGRLLDYMDKYDMWKDTAIVMTTDHGYLLGEHEWWAKNRMPFYDEIAHIPLVIYHPEHAERAGERRNALSQTIDLMPTFLDWYDVEIPELVEGHSLNGVLAEDSQLREAAIFGMFGAATNITDGRYVYFRYPKDMTDQQLYEYTLMPMHQKVLFSVDELKGTQLTDAYAFSKGVPILKIPALRNTSNQPCGHAGQGHYEDTQTRLYDLKVDPGQATPINDPTVEKRLTDAMLNILASNEAPPEAYLRLGLVPPNEVAGRI